MTPWLVVVGVALVAFLVVSRAGTAWASRAAMRAPASMSVAPTVRSLPVEVVCHVIRNAGTGASIRNPGSPLAAFVLRQVLAGRVRATRERLTAKQLAVQDPRAQEVPGTALRLVDWISRVTGPVEFLTLRKQGPPGAGREPLDWVFTEGPSLRRIRNAAGDDDLRSAGRELERRIEAEARRWGIWNARPVGRAVFRTCGIGVLVAGGTSLALGVWGSDWLPVGLAAGAFLGSWLAALAIREPRPPALDSFCRAVDAELAMQVRQMQRSCTELADPDEDEAVLVARAHAVLDAVALLHAVHPNMGSPEWEKPTAWLNGAARHNAWVRDALTDGGWDAAEFPDATDWVYFLTSRVRKAQETDSD
jgi:hypothetical protein